jgi:2-haloacid dehalogenase
MIKIVAFDTFNTVFQLTEEHRKDLKSYNRHVRDDSYTPFEFPESWETLIAHPDAKEGIERLRQNFTVVTMSNGSMDLLTKVSKFNGISWDAIVPIEMNKVYKPNLEAYKCILQLFKVKAEEVAMITANKTFGDIEAADKLGMRPILIREDGHIKDIIHLSNYLSNFGV